MKDLITIEEFLAPVRKRGKIKNPDGSTRDVEAEIRRMQRNPICIQCHEDYRKKYPNQPFQIDCEGVYDQEDFQELYDLQLEACPDLPPIPIESATEPDIRESLDAAYWATKYAVVKDFLGTVVPYEPRWYQAEMLQCTAKHKVDRMGRGTGKTQNAVIEELFKGFTKSNNDILVVCPADSQSEKWWNEINFQILESPKIGEGFLDKKQQPYRTYRFKNGSKINLFTAGSAAGRGADSVRSQSPRRMRIEEQDYLNEKDWDSLTAFLDRYPGESEFHGTSTPTGARGKYYEMCTMLPRYKEFYFPISVHPKWSEDMELTCRQEAKTEERYQHEYLAEFGDLAQGVFKNTFIDIAKGRYSYKTLIPLRDKDNPREYHMGVDWNGEGTGTRIRVVEYTLGSKMARCVDSKVVDHEGFTVFDSINAIEDINKKWHCTSVYIDMGHGHAQYDMLRQKGRDATDFDTKRLAFVKTIDFGGSLEFNTIKPNRTSGRPPTKEEMERRTKPFMVEGAVMRFEQQLIQFSDEDKVLESQLRAYRVKTYSPHGYANTYTAGKEGDHDLDAFMLALLSIEIAHGFYATLSAYRTMAQVSYMTGFGASPLQQTTNTSALEQRKTIAGVNSRTKPDKKTNLGYKLDFLRNDSGGYVQSPLTPKQGTKGVPSRTSIFSPTQTGIYGSGPNPFSQRRRRG